MPQTCSVPGCKGNYRSGPKVSVFSFPRNTEVRERWVRAIGRKDFQPSKFSKVCERHFREEEILKEISAYDERKGKMITAPLFTPRLRKNAVPSLFPKCPAYVSQDVPASQELVSNQELHEEFVIKLEKNDEESEQNSQETLEEQYVVEKVKTNLCRVCGCPGGSLTPILKEEETCTNLFLGVPLVKVLEMYLPLQVNVDDPFPLSICVKCRDTLREWHQFYLTCVAANESFNNLFGEGKHQEASRCAVYSSSAPEETGIISNSSRNNHTYVRDELEETEKMELGFENEDHINAGGLEKSDKKQSCEDKLYFCKYCHHSVNYTEKLEQDVDENQDISASFLSPPYFCKFCRQSYYSTMEMKNHDRLCKEEPTVCDICGKLLLHRKLLAAHKYQKHNSYMRVCDKCGKYVPSVNYSRHCDSFHSGTYCCKLCCHVLSSKTLYREHMRKHKKGQIKNRLKIDPFSADDGVNIYQCPVCKVLFKDLPVLIMHMNEPKTIQCPTCRVKFNNEKRLAIHTCKKWVCHFCQKSFFIRESFLEHERIHTGEKPYKCLFCCASFRKKSRRIMHQRTHGPPSYECKYCDKKFKLAISLRSHMNAHEGVFFSCAICEKKFPGEKYLQRHMKTHESI